MIGAVLAAIAAIFTVLLVIGFLLSPGDPIAELKRKYRVLFRMPPAQVEEALLERVEGLAKKFPGKSYRWYLQWLVTDLERAKR
ncbi:MAG: hypothetical protein AMXMBFR34_14130 [Myxococcaceae bacterium]